jgi:hypothetical protein
LLIARILQSRLGLRKAEGGIGLHAGAPLPLTKVDVDVIALRIFQSLTA